MTPSSGAAPYLLEISIVNKGLINDVDYDFNVYSNNTLGGCPTTSAISVPQVVIANELLDNGSSVFISTVGAGRCLGFKAVITDVHTSIVISEAVVYISNL